MLEAVLEEVSAEHLHELKAACSSTELIDRANKMLTRADQVLRESTQEQRRSLRGFSPEMLALTADQAFRLGHLLARYEQVALEGARKQEALRDTFQLAADLTEQSATLIAKVYASKEKFVDAAVVPQADSKPTAAILAQALIRLARAAGRALREGSPAVKNRATFYGLDGAYVETLTGTASRLTQLEAETKSGGELQSISKAMDHAHSTTAFLLGQVGEAFDMANKLDPRIPRLAAASVVGLSIENTRPRLVPSPLASEIGTPDRPSPSAPTSEVRIIGLRIPVVAASQK
jgi:hypothetical protein